MITPVYFGLNIDESRSSAEALNAFYEEHGSPTLFDRLVAFIGSIRGQMQAAGKDNADGAAKPVASRPARAGGSARPMRPLRPAPVRRVGVAHA